MHPRYPHVFRPVQIGPVEVPNRFYFAPHGVSLGAGTKPTADFVSYSVERVKGGCGLVINSLPVHERGSVSRATPFPKENVPAFRVMADAVHEAGEGVRRGFLLVGSERILGGRSAHRPPRSPRQPCNTSIAASPDRPTRWGRTRFGPWWVPSASRRPIYGLRVTTA